MRKFLLATTCGVLCSTVALANDFSGTLNGSYASFTNNGGGTLWNVSSTAQAMLDNSWGLEGNAAYERQVPGDFDLWSFGGSAFSKFESGRIAATVNYGEIGAGHATQYGLGGDWFAASDITLSLKGGGLSDPSQDGGYIGGQAAWYPIANVALTGSVDYLSAFHENATVTTLKAEWQLSDDLPLSLYGGYQNVHETGAGTSDVLLVGLKFYFDGANSLVDHQRTGSLGYISRPVGLLTY